MGESSFASGFKTGFGSAFLQFALERFATFGSFAWREIRVIFGVEDELRKLQRTFLKVQDLVDHMEGGTLRFSDGNKAWHMWFEDLRKLAYDADALLDCVSLHLSSYCAEHSITAKDESQVLSMVLSSLQGLTLPEKISQMQEKLEELAKEMESLLMIEKLKWDSSKISPTRSVQYFGNSYSRASFIDAETVVGRGQDKESIINLLNEECERGNFSVVPIVGMAGIGKTTLARLVCNDDNVCRSFGKILWVSVSMDFDVVRTTTSIIEAATSSACNLSDLYSLQVELREVLHEEKLQEKKFLLVLDDYWTEIRDDWDTLCSPFRFGLKGSKIIVTTRSMNVSSIVTSSDVYKLEPLQEDDCWKLIKQKALMDVEASQNLELIGKQLANKCKGLPLAAVTLGSLLHRKSTEEEWRAILECELWDMPQDKNVFPALMLSYLHLPAHLQRCFAYCSIFPQNHEFEVEELVLLWMAEGFIQPVGTRRLEDLGNDYFNDLYARYFFQEFTSTSHKKIYKMHDLLHDLARLVSKDICFHVKYSMSSYHPLFGNTCHLSLLHDNTQPLELKASLKNERLSTPLVMSNNLAARGEVDPQLFQNLQFLRVLGLGYIGLSELPSSIENLIYLRYLNLSGNPILHLPNSVCKFVALQTLKLRSCPNLVDLPEDMRNLISLRHLEFDVNAKLQPMPLQFGRLTNLQTLSAYIIGSKNGNGIGELKNMKCLRGSFCIKNLNYVSNVRDAVEAKLSMMTCLDKLELHWRKLRDGLDPQVLNQRRSDQAEVFENLQPHGNLKQLVIENYCGIIYPSWLSEPLLKFTSIHLKGLKYCGSLPCLGQLRFLKSFVVSDLPCLKSVELSFYGTGNEVKFPSLELFELRGMSSLRDWRNESDSAMPRLITFTIDDCPNLESLPPGLRHLLPNAIISNCPIRRTSVP